MESDKSHKKVIKVTDKRGVASSPPSDGGDLHAPPSDGGDLHGTHTEHAGTGAISGGSSTGRVSETASLLQTPPSPGLSEETEHDYLDDLKRL